jgi:hypothetical protein
MPIKPGKTGIGLEGMDTAWVNACRKSLRIRALAEGAHCGRVTVPVCDQHCIALLPLGRETPAPKGCLLEWREVDVRYPSRRRFVKADVKS